MTKSRISARQRAFVGAATLVMGVSFVSSARAASHVEGAIPDSARLAVLRVRLASQRVIRVVGSFGAREVSQPILDSAGVRSGSVEQRVRRPATLMTPAAPSESARPPIPWREISAVQTGHSMVGRGAIYGFLLGGALGVTLARVSTGNGSSGEGKAFRAIGIFSGTVMAGTVAGAAVGSACGWRTVYRASEPENR